MPRPTGRNAKDKDAGNPNLRIEQRTRDEVYNRARELKVKGRSTMTKSELIEAVKIKQNRAA